MRQQESQSDNWYKRPVTCREFQELISPAVDLLLGKEEMFLFLEHARACPPCGSEYQMELTTKRIVRTKARMVRTPPVLAHSILRMVKDDAVGHPARLALRWRAVLGRPLVKPALALSIFLALLSVILIRTPRPSESIMTASLGPKDVMLQSLRNYRAVVSGTIQPQLVSEEHEKVRQFFSGITQFPVLVPALNQCTLVGGVLNEFGGAPLAHIVYRRADKLIYIYQACWSTVQRGEALDLPPHVKSALQATGWYTASMPEGSSIALWTNGQTLCAAVAQMSPEELHSCLAVSKVVRPAP